MDVSLTRDGVATQYSGIDSLTTTETPAPPPPTSIKYLKITDAPYNAAENKSATDNYNAIKKCFADAKTQKADVVIPPGTYQYNNTLTQDGIRVFNNGTLFATTSEVGYYFKGAGPRLIGGTLMHEGITWRGSQMWHHGIGIFDQTGPSEIIDVTVINPSAAGICCWDGRNIRFINITIEDCNADGIHTVSSKDGRSENNFYKDCTVRRAGDDCLSFVTYGDSNPNVANCEVWNFRGSDNTWGRGITVLGAEGIVINGAILQNIKCFGIYVGKESGYGSKGQAVMNDIKLDVCGQVSSTSTTADGVLLVWGGAAFLELNDSVISRPLHWGVYQYNGTVYTPNNVIYNECPWGNTNIPPASTGMSYKFPRRGRIFEGPRRIQQPAEEQPDEEGSPSKLPVRRDLHGRGRRGSRAG